MRYLVVDVEATCWENQQEFQRANTEVIEIGAVSIVDGVPGQKELQLYVKPKKYPILSDYCKNLTGITQEQVDKADFAEDVYTELACWITTGQDLLGGTLVSWGMFDWKILKREFETNTPFRFPFNTFVNLKNSFAAYEGARPKGLSRAIKSLGWEFEGQHHCGLHDARNTAKIFNFLIKEAPYVIAPARL